MADELCDLLAPSRIVYDNTSQSKSALLAKISHLFKQSLPEVDEQTLCDDFINRERLGSTAIGRGIAIPHVRNRLIQHACACFVKLDHAIDFGAQDEQPVDLFIALLVPEDKTEQHLAILANVATQFASPSFCQQLRATSNDHQLIDSLLRHEEALTA